MAKQIILLCIALSLVLSVIAYPSALNYQVGQELEFSLHATLDARGREVDTAATTGGVTSTMDAILAIKCTQKNATSFLFVMNMFNTEVNVGSGVSNGILVGDDNDNALGEDMYFEQNVDGQITNIWYESDDDPYFVQVKVGAINSLQTKLIPAGTTQTVLESDPVGVHYSVFDGASGTVLQVTKSYTQNDFEKFPDPQLHKSNVQIQGSASAQIHDSGYIQAASVTQSVLLIDASPASSSSSRSNPSAAANDDQTGTSLNLLSSGTMQVSLATSHLPSENFVSRFPDAKRSTALLSESKSMTASSLFDVARVAAVSAQETGSVGVDKVALAERVRAQLSTLFKDTDRAASLVRVARSLAILPELLADIDQWLQHTSVMAEPRARSRIFSLLALVGSERAHELLVRHGVSSRDPAVVRDAVLGASHARVATARLLDALAAVAYDRAMPTDVAHAAVLSFASVARTSYDDRLLSQARSLADVVAKQSAAVQAAALANAGLAPGKHLLVGDNPDFPYNVNWTKDLDLGGKVAFFDITGELFAGTNLDCNHTTFNYQALAQASGTVGLFGDTHSAFLAQAVYGRDNGAPLANQIYLSVWDQVLYQKPLPTLDCAPHSYQLFHAAPGFSVSYTLWVTVIPVIFRADATLEATVTWDWSVCDADLSAQVEIVPSASVVLGGSAEIDLLVIKAAVELDGQFNSAIVPQAYVHGTQCEIGFDVRHTAQPMQANFHSYYMVKKCKFLLFDCHWGPENDHTWWSWSGPAIDEILYQKQWHIGV